MELNYTVCRQMNESMAMPIATFANLDRAIDYMKYLEKRFHKSVRYTIIRHDIKDSFVEKD